MVKTNKQLTEQVKALQEAVIAKEGFIETLNTANTGLDAENTRLSEEIASTLEHNDATNAEYDKEIKRLNDIIEATDFGSDEEKPAIIDDASGDEVVAPPMVKCGTFTHTQKGKAVQVKVLPVVQGKTYDIYLAEVEPTDG